MIYAMVANMSHTPGTQCPGCEEKVQVTHPLLASWFRRVKAKYPFVHIAWSYRNAAEQNKLFKEKKTRAEYPMSKHNQMMNGKPCSKALDLFVLSEEGEARWPPLFYAKINEENVRNNERILWAGKWKGFLETCHFELAEDKNENENKKAA